MLYIRCIEAGIFQGAALVEENILLGVHISSQKLCPIYTPLNYLKGSERYVDSPIYTP